MWSSTHSTCNHVKRREMFNHCAHKTTPAGSLKAGVTQHALVYWWIWLGGAQHSDWVLWTLTRSTSEQQSNDEHVAGDKQQALGRCCWCRQGTAPAANINTATTLKMPLPTGAATRHTMARLYPVVPHYLNMGSNQRNKHVVQHAVQPTINHKTRRGGCCQQRLQTPAGSFKAGLTRNALCTGGFTWVEHNTVNWAS